MQETGDTDVSIAASGARSLRRGGLDDRGTRILGACSGRGTGDPVLWDQAAWDSETVKVPTMPVKLPAAL